VAIQQALGDDGLAAVQPEHAYALSNVRPGDGRGDGQPRPELIGLKDGAVRQFAAGYAGGEAEDSSRCRILLPAWPPGAVRSSTHRLQSLRAP